jgi:hypothetical protein
VGGAAENSPHEICILSPQSLIEILRIWLADSTDEGLQGPSVTAFSAILPCMRSLPRYVMGLPKFILPVNGRPVMLMGPRFPIAILPGIVTELRSVSELSLGDACAITPYAAVVLQSRPGDRIVAVSQAEKTSKTHHRVGNPASDLLNQQMVDLADRFITHTVNLGALDIFTRYEPAVGVRCSFSHCSLRR